EREEERHADQEPDVEDGGREQCVPEEIAPRRRRPGPRPRPDLWPGGNGERPPGWTTTGRRLRHALTSGGRPSGPLRISSSIGRLRLLVLPVDPPDLADAPLHRVLDGAAAGHAGEHVGNDERGEHFLCRWRHGAGMAEERGDLALILKG